MSDYNLLLCFAVEYMAPEVVTRSPGYTKPADWWSYGIFTFDLLTGRSPFHSNRGKQETKERILRGKFHTPAFLTPMAQDLIRRLLRRPVDKRLGSKGGAQEVKNHEFFNGICWEKVLKREYQPPFVPSLANAEDVSNFDTRFTSKSPRESNESPVGQSSGISTKKFHHICGKFLLTSSFVSLSEATDEQEMFDDFDYVCPELAARLGENGTDLNSEMQDLRIRVFGD